MEESRLTLGPVAIFDNFHAHRKPTYLSDAEDDGWFNILRIWGTDPVRINQGPGEHRMRMKSHSLPASDASDLPADFESMLISIWSVTLDEPE